jgi:Amt family ammonium transporter
MEKFGRKHVDDTLDVFACHGMGGTVGMVCTALFSSAAAGGTDGAFYGDPVALGKCLIVLVVLVLWFCLFTWGCLGLTHLLIALRVPDMSEVEGLDALGNRHPSGGVVLSIAKLKKLHSTS